MGFEIDYKASASGRLRYGEIPWDTEVFEFPVIRLCVEGDAQGIAAELEGVLAVADRHDRALIVSRVPLEDIEWQRALCAHRFYPVETSLQPYRELSRFEPGRRFAGLELRPVQAGELDRVLEIARSAFSRGRYHLDANVPRAGADERYARWIQNAVRDGDDVLVFCNEKSGDVLGFYHLRDLGEGTADLSLAALAPESHGLGLGPLLYDQCLEACVQRGFSRVETHISVANTAVLNIYSGLGFSFRSPEVVLHRFAEGASS